MKSKWVALAMACAVTACGGGDDGGAPTEHTLAVRPHLGTVLPGAPLLLIPLGYSGAPLTTTMPASGDPAFKVPANRCGPGIVALAGSAQTRYFDEGTQQYETLPDGEAVRALIPDICGHAGPVSLSMLDEIALHIDSERAATLKSSLKAIIDSGVKANAGVNPQLVQNAVQDAAALKAELDAILAATLGLPPDFHSVLPTTIEKPGTHLSSSQEDHVAAMLKAFAEALAKMRAAALDEKSKVTHEDLAILLAKQAEMVARLSQQRADVASVGALMQLLAGAVGAVPKFDYTGAAGAAAAGKKIGLQATRIAQDLPSIIAATRDGFNPDNELRHALDLLVDQIRAQLPVPSADMTLTMRAALVPALLRGETPERLNAAVANGQAQFACTEGALTRGTVAVRFIDNDASNTLSNGDVFEQTYDDCLVVEPLSGMTLARTGTMSLEYDDATTGGGVADIRGHVNFSMRFSAGGARPGATPATLFQANGNWVDRAAFGAPGVVDASPIAGGIPAVLLDDATLTITQNGTTYTTQDVAARLDLTPSFGRTGAGQSGQAALQASGMIGGVFYGTDTPLIITRDAAVPRLTGGTLNYDRQLGGSGTGSLTAKGDGNVTVRITAASATTERTLPWQPAVATYLAP